MSLLNSIYSVDGDSFSHADYHLLLYILYHTKNISQHTHTYTHMHAYTLLQLVFVNVRRGMKISRQTSLHDHIVCCMIDI